MGDIYRRAHTWANDGGTGDAGGESMTSFFTTLLRLLSAIWHGREDPEFKALFKLLLIVLISGVAFYTQVEGWSYLDALYFSVITMATIGYGDLSPVTTSGKIFTMFFALVSIGIFVSLAAKIGAILLAREQNHLQKRAEKRNSRKGS
jgi:voltage-gated potassium channel Kch